MARLKAILPKSMARRTLNRMDLRRMAELAEEQGAVTPAIPPDPSRGTASRRARGKKGPARVCARWGVFDASMKLVATFDYKERAQAEQKVAELNAQRKGIHFLQMVKEPMDESDPNDLE
jgi:hypothetical protein